MGERNIKLTVEYKGTAYAGWQIQAAQRTIQQEITEAIRKTTGKEVNLIGAGRTDAGVHALGQVANFRIDHDLPAEKFRDALNYYLDIDIRIKQAIEVPVEFHARFDAASKRYRYLLSGEQSALYRDYRWEYPKEISFDRLKDAAKLIVGEHDFSPFCVTASLKENNACIIYHTGWRRVGPLLVFEISGNRFLHTMVRSLVGAMLNLATVSQDKNKQNLTLQQFGDILLTAPAERIIFTAPPQGLYLVKVSYKSEGQSA